MKRLEDMTEPELRHLGKALASGIEDCSEWLGVERPRFCLVLFNDPKQVRFVSNATMADAVYVMRETAGRLARQDEPR